tara:strand:+ start:21745 stop:22566 length:822 start_codon:yes stop_codon:yes gene_type:complete
MNQLFHFIAKLPSFPGKLTLANKVFSDENKNYLRRINGGALLNLNLNDRIQRRIYIKGVHEPETEAPLLELAKDSKCFVDIGANVGYFSMMLSQVYPNLEVHCFEPMPRNIQALKLNKETNKNNINIHEVCLSDENTEVEFAIPPEGECGWGRIAQGELVKNFENRIKVPARTLDQMLSQEVFKSPPDLIKIDVEGNEMRVLKGAAQLLSKHSPTICIEINEECLVDNQTTGAEIFNYLKNLGYQAHLLENSKLKKINQVDTDYKFLNYFFIK